MRFALFIITVLVAKYAGCQNLVPNGSFEHYSRCPGDFSQSPTEFQVNHWSSASAGTPDYFNACSHGEADVPHNWAGVSDPYEGTGFAGLYLWMAVRNNYREYLQVQLTERLLRDSVYYINFRYKLSSYSKYSIDRIGLHLSDSSIHFKHDGVLNVQPILAIVKDTALTRETGLWEEGKITYKAHGGEKFLLVGNFSTDRETRFYKIQFRPTPQPMVAHSSYYYIDDVSLVSRHFHNQRLLTEIVPAFAIEETKSNTTYVLRNINFQFNSFRLIPPSFSELDQVAEYLLKHPQLDVQLFGHTDDQGGDAYNLKLSQARAKNVSEYLASVGVRGERIQYFGYGKTKPLKDERSEEARALNRRVEIRFIEP
jgi:OmpA-OmpF porin, OOP family